MFAVVRLDQAEEERRVNDRVESLRRVAELSDAATLWHDPVKCQAVVLLQDRIRQVDDLVERCHAALASLYDSMFPLNPLPVGLAALLEKFNYGKDIKNFVRAQLVAGAEVALAFVRSHHPNVDFAAVAKGPPPGRRKRTFMQGHYDAVESSANEIADLLVKESDESKEQPDEPQDDRKGKKKRGGKKKKPRLEILDFM